jgi:choline monooxygenase
MWPSYYFEDTILIEENKNIFTNCWNFVCFTEQVAESGQFVTVEIAGISVVVQNFKGELRALHNVCSHRFSIIQKEKCGKRSLSCPYHGWSYDKEGVPNIPGNFDYFKLTEEDRKKRALRSFSLEICGRFIFVRLANEGLSLGEYLGANADVLRHLSNFFVDQVDIQNVTWQTNWKLGVESVLEVYHLAQVHPESFNNFVQSRWEINVDAKNNNGTAYLAENSSKWWNGARERLKLNQSQLFQNYDHFFIFPNLAIAVSHGCLMSVQTYMPLSIDTSQLNYQIFMSASKLAKDKQKAVRKAVIDNVTTFNRVILAEDQLTMEQVQKGTSQMEILAIHGANEARIQKFHNDWYQWMRGASFSVDQKV